MTRSQRVREIRKINARFRKLKKKDGPMADRLMVRKDALIDAIQADCEHSEVIETKGDVASQPSMKRPAELRLCLSCGLVEKPSIPDGYASLTVMPKVMAHDEYLLRQGKVLKMLGINL